MNKLQLILVHVLGFLLIGTIVFVYWDLKGASLCESNYDLHNCANSTQPVLSLAPTTRISPRPNVSVSPAAAESTDTSLFQSCLTQTSTEGYCKDCCDCLAYDAGVKTACRDLCPTQNYSQNTNAKDATAPSTLGANGDYSNCSSLSTEQECKQCCDSSTTFACGDFKYCRNVCNAKFGTGQ